MLIGASLSEPHTSVTALCTRVSIRLSMDRPLARASVKGYSAIDNIAPTARLQGQHERE